MAEQQKFTLKLPKWFDEDDLIDAGEDVIQFIIDRCQVGQGIRPGNQRYDFPEYTEAYLKKKGSKRVDLVLNDEMLRSIQILDLDVDDLTVDIGFRAGTKQNAKAEGNQIGSYGRAPDPKKARRFLGINREELTAVLARFK